MLHDRDTLRECVRCILWCKPLLCWLRSGRRGCQRAREGLLNCRAPFSGCREAD